MCVLTKNAMPCRNCSGWSPAYRYGAYLSGMMVLKRDTSFAEEVESYDAANDSDLKGFLAMLDKMRSEEPVPLAHYIIGVAGPLLNHYGIIGQITASRSSVNKRHSNDIAHSLSDREWYDVIRSINNPVAVARYNGREQSFRIYTSILHDNMNIVVGIDIKQVGRDRYVSNVKTAFARSIDRLAVSTKEIILYDARTAMGKSSSAHNSRIYSQSPITTHKGSDTLEFSKEK